MRVGYGEYITVPDGARNPGRRTVRCPADGRSRRRGRDSEEREVEAWPSPCDYDAKPIDKRLLRQSYLRLSAFIGPASGSSAIPETASFPDPRPLYGPVSCKSEQAENARTPPGSKSVPARVHGQ